jgi:glycosyltransferase involved in cell wall biosynthesis
MKRLSVIVPIYNVELYVERCLRSLEDQDIPENEFEIICINDGSLDNSSEIVLRLQQEFDNIILIDQENQGVSRARNKGIDRAIGKYVVFIDPDDYVDTNSFGRILKNADKQDAQVSFLDFTILNEDGSIDRIISNQNHISQKYLGIEVYFLTRVDGHKDPDRMWAILFQTQFLNHNHLRYLPDVPYLEDGEFIARILCLAEVCIFDGHSFYQRTTRPGSATNSGLFFSDRSIHGFLLAAINLKKFQQERSLGEKQRYFLNQPICKFVLLALNSSLQNPYFKRYKWIRRKLQNDGFKKIELNGVVKPYVHYGFLYNYLPALFLIKAYFKAFKQIAKSIFRPGSVCSSF